MKNKILDIVGKKICDGFKTKLLPREQFKNEFNLISKTILDTLNPIVKDYIELINKRDTSVIKFSKNEYIVNEFESNFHRHRYFNQSNNRKVNVTLIKSEFRDEYKEYAADYNDGLSSNNSSIVVPIAEYIKRVTNEVFEPQDLKEEFWYFFHVTFFQHPYRGNISKESIEELEEFPKILIQLFKDHYLNNKYVLLLDIVEKHLDDISFTPFDFTIVNVGERNDQPRNAGWITNNFKVINNNIVYPFTISSKDKNAINGEFINVFVLQKKYLIKINVTLKEDEQIKYIVWKDFEKVTVKNDSELLIEKHHGNETIIFDNRKSALEFRDKIIEIKEGSKSRQAY